MYCIVTKQENAGGSCGCNWLLSLFAFTLCACALFAPIHCTNKIRTRRTEWRRFNLHHVPRFLAKHLGLFSWKIVLRHVFLELIGPQLCLGSALTFEGLQNLSLNQPLPVCVSVVTYDSQGLFACCASAFVVSFSPKLLSSNQMLYVVTGDSFFNISMLSHRCSSIVRC